RADRQLILTKSHASRSSAPFAKRRIVAGDPDSGMGVEQNHLRAFHSISIGEMISPVMNTRPLSMPNAFRLRCLYGLSSAIALPFFVITTLSPVRSTSSISARHLALNSEAFIIRDMGPPYDHGDDHSHIATESPFQSRTFTKLPGASSSGLSLPLPGTRAGTSSSP